MGKCLWDRFSVYFPTPQFEGAENRREVLICFLSTPTFDPVIYYLHMLLLRTHASFTWLDWGLGVSHSQYTAFHGKPCSAQEPSQSELTTSLYCPLLQIAKGRKRASYSPHRFAYHSRRKEPSLSKAPKKTFQHRQTQKQNFLPGSWTLKKEK